MPAQILANTPAWVFVLFFALLLFGLLQTRTRAVRRLPALLLPAGMMALSLAGIHTSFGWQPIALATWAVALALSSLLGVLMFRDKRVAYDALTKRFSIPGSWMPLGVIMAIFVAKYAHAVLRAVQAPLITAPFFIVLLSAIYGLLSGYFAARAYNFLKTAGMV